MVIKNLSPAQLKALAETDLELDIVDVREPSEWSTGHVPRARLVPLDQVRANPKGAAPRSNVCFVCAKGGRSATAAKLVEALGYADVFSLDGGTLEWMRAGLAIVVPPPPEPATSKKKAPKAEPSSSSAEITEPALDAVVGLNLREERTRRGLTLDALARQAGVSRALLGQIELGRSTPSIGVVWKLAQSLGVPFSLLLSTQDRTGTEVLRKSRARRLLSADGRFSSRALFPFAGQRTTEFYELWLAPHGREDADPHQPGTRENIIVTAGRLELALGEEKILLETGDAVMFTADVPHSYNNPDSADCWMNLVMTYAVPVG
ncbi:MAG: rhodanese-like domain-containing protein [Deltaproteobacteria bacterium]|nr:rhodanese-like domain-containing protein [Deltaproteobacteria bacterium]